MLVIQTRVWMVVLVMFVLMTQLGMHRRLIANVHQDIQDLDARLVFLMVRYSNLKKTNNHSDVTWKLLVFIFIDMDRRNQELYRGTKYIVL